MNASPAVKDALYKLHGRIRMLEEAELQVKAACVKLQEQVDDLREQLSKAVMLIQALNERIPDLPTTGAPS